MGSAQENPRQTQLGGVLMEIGPFEAKNTFGALLDRVEKGEEIVITRNGKRVARLVPNSRRIDAVQARAAVEGMRGRAKTLEEAFDWESLKTDRDEGRP